MAERRRFVSPPKRDPDGTCHNCGKTPLPPRRVRWCSDECGRAYAMRHDWNALRDAAFKRDGYHCVKCGRTRRDTYSDGRSVRLEADHIIEVADGGPEFDLDNVQTLCDACHKAKSADSAARRAARRRSREGAGQLPLAL